MADACSVVTNQFYTNVRCQGLRLQAAQAFEQQQTGNAISTVKHRTCSVRGLTCKHQRWKWFVVGEVEDLISPPTIQRSYHGARGRGAQG